MRYPALIDGKDGAYGVVFPDLPGMFGDGLHPSMTLCWMPRSQSGSGWMLPKNAAYPYPIRAYSKTLRFLKVAR